MILTNLLLINHKNLNKILEFQKDLVKCKESQVSCSLSSLIYELNPDSYLFLLINFLFVKYASTITSIDNFRLPPQC